MTPALRAIRAGSRCARLNRTEYENTIRDLVGVEFSGDELPSDDVGFGFDNIGDVLTISPLHMERYLAAAENIMKRAILAGDLPKVQYRTQQARFLEPAMKIPKGQTRPVTSKVPLFTSYSLSAGGDGKFVARLTPVQVGDEPRSNSPSCSTTRKSRRSRRS